MTTYIILGVAAAILVFLGVLIIRAINFKPLKGPELQTDEVTFDNDLAIENLSELIKCKTVSYNDKSLEDDAEFNKLTGLLPKLYPNVYKVCEQIDIPDRAILLKWQGRSDAKPTVLMAHYDVVPVNEENWEKPPFDAIIEDGVLWGRGALDTKITFNSILFATEKLITDGFVPEHDIYLAFSGGEEINGPGAVNIVDYFEKNGIELGLVVDEGGGVVENVFPGVRVPCGLIGIAEKGLMNVEYKCSSKGGHASAPKPNSPVVRLSRACCKIESHPFKSHFTTPVLKMFDTLGRHSSFVFKIIFSNLWLFRPVLDMICRSGGGELNALVRTTVAFTKMQGSSAYNVIPPKATLVSNMRLNPVDTMDSALEYLKNTVNDEDVEINIIEGMNPSRISEIDCEAWDKVASAVASTWKGCIVAPYLMMQCSDSRHYGRISDKVYRFSAMDLTAEERATIHGDNERIRLDAAARTVEFYIRLITQC